MVCPTSVLRELCHPRAIQRRTEQLLFLSVASVRRDVHHVLGFINGGNATEGEFARGHLCKLMTAQIVQVPLRPSTPLRQPEESFAIFEEAEWCWGLPESWRTIVHQFYERRVVFRQDSAYRTSGGIGGEQLEGVLMTVEPLEEKL